MHSQPTVMCTEISNVVLEKVDALVVLLVLLLHGGGTVDFILGEGELTRTGKLF